MELASGHNAHVDDLVSALLIQAPAEVLEEVLVRRGGLKGHGGRWGYGKGLGVGGKASLVPRWKREVRDGGGLKTRGAYQRGERNAVEGTGAPDDDSEDEEEDEEEELHHGRGLESDPRTEPGVPTNPVPLLSLNLACRLVQTLPRLCRLELPGVLTGGLDSVRKLIQLSRHTPEKGAGCGLTSVEQSSVGAVDAPKVDLAEGSTGGGVEGRGDGARAKAREGKAGRGISPLIDLCFEDLDGPAYPLYSSGPSTSHFWATEDPFSNNGGGASVQEQHRAPLCSGACCVTLRLSRQAQEWR